MKCVNFLSVTISCASLMVGLVGTSAAATGGEQTDTYRDDCNYSSILINEDGSKPTKDQYDEKARLEQACQQNNAEIHKKAITARVTLKNKFNIDASHMTDRDAINRLKTAEEDAKQAAEQAKERQEQEAAAQREQQATAAMKQQNQMMQSLGVTLPAADDDDDDADLDRAQEQMYRKMVEGGAAPQCKGKEGTALIECVDAALGD
jgi:hypothetical protein